MIILCIIQILGLLSLTKAVLNTIVDAINMISFIRKD